MHNLGLRLGDTGNLDGAEHWFREAAMVKLGLLRQDRGDVRGAETWFQRAAVAGFEEGVTGLDALHRKLGHDRELESVAFDTFGWELTQNRDKHRRWQSGNASLSERFISGPSDFRAWDAEQIQEDMRATQALLESPSFNIEDLDHPEWIGPFPHDLPEQHVMLEVECFRVQGTKCVLATHRNRMRGSVNYTAVIFILFADCFWLIASEVARAGGCLPAHNDRANLAYGVAQVWA
jgi:Tetratricopeptide repeat